jgi:trehalose 6-phosphate synthase
MVTPLRDGMNLIAKEYVAAQDTADPGVLILSKFTGAAEQMTAALIVNPYSVEETAEAIRAALEMTLTERCERHGALLAGLQKHDAAAWSQSFLEHLKRLRSTTAKRSEASVVEIWI